MSIPAVILAAGTSTRLRPFTDHLPKSLLPVAGVSMLERSIRHLMMAGVREIIIVTGFHADKLTAAVHGWFPRLSVTTIHNPDYATTNNGYSLRLAAEKVAGRPFILLDSDLVYDGGILPELMASGRTSLALRPAPDLGSEEVKVSVDARGLVNRISKEVPVEESVGESIGIEVFDGEASAALFASLERRIGGLGLVNEYYEAAFQEIIDQGVGMHVVDISPFRAMEIDTPRDLEAAETVFGTTMVELPVAAMARVRALTEA
jgi:choline kinase